MPLLLQGVGFRVGLAQQSDFLRLNLVPLAFALGLHHLADYAHAASGGQGVGDGIGRAVLADHYLQVAESGAVVDLHEGHGARRAASLDPALHQRLSQGGVAGQDVADSGALHLPPPKREPGLGYHPTDEPTNGWLGLLDRRPLLFR